eukprot:CAMPEP_0177591784 /NCGR_PEP_ID=MMETSP0419_2-20121207/8191_1 /TAXON_ID=582737 /ORGANISM="Tetraselmis sp., Strain GSL018" /LENGTH=774 /DNA_ID=CAMNT_0019082567 /DNA_START=446 /DNA_END=2770 /DNA_ORIENTATION=-
MATKVHDVMIPAEDVQSIFDGVLTELEHEKPKHYASNSRRKGLTFERDWAMDLQGHSGGSSWEAFEVLSGAELHDGFISRSNSESSGKSTAVTGVNRGRIGSVQTRELLHAEELLDDAMVCEGMPQREHTQLHICSGKDCFVCNLSAQSKAHASYARSARLGRRQLADYPGSSYWTRMAVKVDHVTPAELPANLRPMVAEALQLAPADDSLVGYIRPGCVHLLVEARTEYPERALRARAALPGRVAGMLVRPEWGSCAASMRAQVSGRVLSVQKGRLTGDEPLPEGLPAIVQADAASAGPTLRAVVEGFRVGSTSLRLRSDGSYLDSGVDSVCQVGSDVFEVSLRICGAAPKGIAFLEPFCDERQLLGEAVPVLLTPQSAVAAEISGAAAKGVLPPEQVALMLEDAAAVLNGAESPKPEAAVRLALWSCASGLGATFEACMRACTQHASLNDIVDAFGKQLLDAAVHCPGREMVYRVAALNSKATQALGLRDRIRGSPRSTLYGPCRPDPALRAGLCPASDEETQPSRSTAAGLCAGLALDCAEAEPPETEACGETEESGHDQHEEPRVIDADAPPAKGGVRLGIGFLGSFAIVQMLLLLLETLVACHGSMRAIQSFVPGLACLSFRMVYLGNSDSARGWRSQSILWPALLFWMGHQLLTSMVQMRLSVEMLWGRTQLLLLLRLIDTALSSILVAHAIPSATASCGFMAAAGASAALIEAFALAFQGVAMKNLSLERLLMTACLNVVSSAAAASLGKSASAWLQRRYPRQTKFV